MTDRKKNDALELVTELDEIVDKALVIYAALKGTGYLPKAISRIADQLFPILAVVTESLKMSLATLK